MEDIPPIKPAEIRFQKWPDDVRPLVSISCLTYNHENYIRDAIEGFLSQKTSFRTEIQIHDDASSDKTAEIVRKYESKFPDLIKPIYQSENQYTQGVNVGLLNRARATGKYIAMCEGDDYWIDPYKLQKQVNILESMPELSMCITSVKRDYEHQQKEPEIIRASKSDRIFYLEDILKKNFVLTNSVVFRREHLKEIPENVRHAFNFDYVMWVELAKSGPIYYLDDLTAVYRIHDSGIYSSLDRIKQIKTSLRTRYLLLENLECDQKKYMYKNIFDLNNRLIDFHIKKNNHMQVSEASRRNLELYKFWADRGLKSKVSLFIKSKYQNALFRSLYKYIHTMIR